MKWQQKHIYYELPTVEVTEVAIEQGFAVSGWGNDTYDDHNFGERTYMYYDEYEY